jgi:hypothetical protein
MIVLSVITAPSSVTSAGTLPMGVTARSALGSDHGSIANNVMRFIRDFSCAAIRTLRP